MILSACANNPSQGLIPTAESSKTSVARSVIPTITRTPQTQPKPAESIRSEKPTPDVLVEICPTEKNWCLLAGHFWFNSPILNGNTRSSDVYRYGSNQNNTRETHHGIEFPNANGTQVVSSADGLVIYAGFDQDDQLAWVPAFYGNVVILEHKFANLENPLYTLYAHLDSMNVKVGDKVKTGEEIGRVGMSGTAIGAHLHYEVRVSINDYEHNQNPLLWIKPSSNEGVIAGKVMDKNQVPIPSIINVQKMEEGVLNPTSVTTIETYHQKSLPVKQDLFYGEHFAAGNFPPGSYRLSLVYYGRVIEQIVDVKSNQLTFVNFIVE